MWINKWYENMPNGLKICNGQTECQRLWHFAKDRPPKTFLKNISLRMIDDFNNYYHIAIVYGFVNCFVR